MGGTRQLATLVGFSAIVMWALLALLTVRTGAVPPFQLTAMCFALSGGIGLVRWLFIPSARAALRQPPAVWITGVAGLFLYHAFYFTALRNAPAVDASLIAYLWPLFIVLFSSLLPGERLLAAHLAGAGMGLAGAALIVTGRGSVDLDPAHAVGYLAAFACALTWSGYSVLSRRFAEAPTDVVTGFCLATSVLSLACHLALEPTVWPASASQWLAVAGLGLLPVGLAFFTWDYGVKHGDIQLLCVLSYAAPLLSTLILIAAGEAAPTWRIAAACLLITGGALIAARAGKRKTA
ncbi:MAG: DMT family transporter [Flavobacteriaceae bacterium]